MPGRPEVPLKAPLRQALPFVFSGVVLAALFVSAAIVERSSPPARSDLATTAGARPGRLVSITPATTEILFAIGAGDRVVGVTRYCDWPPEAKALPRIGEFNRPDVEAIVALRPDLILGTPSPANRPAVEKLQSLGLAVAVHKASTIDELKSAIAAVGRATGEEAGARRLLLEITRSFRDVAERAKPLKRPKVLFVVSHDPIYAASPGSIPGRLIELAGGRNVVGDSKTEYVPFTIEQAIAAAPEVIIDATAMGDVKANPGYWARWRDIPAVRDGRVHAASGDYVYLPGPRIGRGLREIAGLIHPEVFVRGREGAE